MGFDSGSVDLGSAYGTIGARFDEQSINASLDRIQQTVAGRLGSIGQSFQRIGGQMTVALSPVTGFATKGILAYAKFDDILTEIEARTGATASEMESVRATALQMGQDTAFSASDASQAMLELLSSGSSLNETMSMLPDVLNLAAAGSLNLGTSADALTDILAQFQLDASESTRVVDALSAANQSSSATMEDLIAAYQNVGNIATGFKISIEESAAVLGVLAENGVKGSEAGTALRSMLLNMTRPTDDVAAAWDDLGTSFTDAQGNMRPLDDVIKDINDGLDGMSDEQRNQIIQDLAGSYGQTALRALLAADGIDAMSESMEGATEASVLAAAKMESFRGVIRQIGSSIETLMLNMLGPLVDDYLKPLAAVVVLLLNKFNAWLVANPLMAEALGLFVAQLAIAGPLLFALGTALVFVTGPMLLIAGLVGLLAAGIAVFAVAWRNNLYGIQDIAESVSNAVVSAFDRMRAVASSGAGIIATVFGAGGIAGLAGSFELSISHIFTLIRILPLLMTPLGALVVLAGAVGWAIHTNFLGIGDRARPVLEGLASAFDRLKRAAERIKTAFDTGGLQSAFASSTEEMQGMFSELQTTGQQAFQNFFSSTLPNAIAQAQSMGPQLWAWVRDTLPQASFILGVAAGEFTRMLGEALIAHGPTVLSALIDVLTWVATTGIPEAAGLLISVGVSFVNGFVTGLLGQDTTLLGALELLAVKIRVWIVTQGPGLAANLLEMAATFIKGFWDGIFAQVPMVLGALDLLAVQVRAWIVTQGPGLAMQLLTWATAFSQWVVAAAPEMAVKLGVLWLEFLAWMQQKAVELATVVAPWAWEFSQWAFNAWGQLLPKLFVLWLQFVAWVFQKALELPGLMAGWALAFTGWVIDSIPAIRAKLDEWRAEVFAWIREQAVYFGVQFNLWQREIAQWVEDSVPALLEKLDAWLADFQTWITDNKQTLIDDFTSVGTEIIGGLQAGIESAWEGFVSYLEGLWNSLPGPLKKIAEIGSPSRVFMELGGDIIEGLRLGLADNDAVMNTMAGLANQLTTPFPSPALAPAQGGVTHQNSSSVSTVNIAVQMPEAALNMPIDRVREVGNAFGEGIRDRLQWELRKNQ